MNKEQIRRFVMDYLEATDCHIIESTPFHVTVKLSERADRQLTNRPYYWNFIDRTGAEPKTMCFTFVFDPVTTDLSRINIPTSQSLTAGGHMKNTIVSRYFNVAPTFNGGRAGLETIPSEDVTFGSKRLTHIIQATYEQGRFISLFIIPNNDVGSTSRPVQKSNPPIKYEPWLLLNVKVEFACDLKREEIHSYGISLVSGRIRTQFMEQLQTMLLTPKLPPHIYIVPWRITIKQARSVIEARIIQMISSYDNTWAIEASKRLNEELARLSTYYEPQLQVSNEQTINENDALNKQEQIRRQYNMRCQELHCQFEPRIRISMLNAGFIYFPSTMSTLLSSE